MTARATLPTDAPPEVVPCTPRRSLRSVAERNALVERNVRLVRHVVKRIAARVPAHVDHEDLVAAGLEGLLRAAERYDETRGVAFSSFAACSIRGMVLDALRAMDPLARPTRHRVQLVEAAESALAARWGGQVPNEELAQEAGISVSDLRDALHMRRASAQVSLSDERREGPLADILADNRTADVATQLLLAEARTALREEIDQLTERDRTVIVLYYGDGLLLREIAGILGVTEGRVSQIHKRAVERLREALRRRGLTD